MKAFIATVALGAFLLLPSGGLVFGGQPNASCPDDSSLAPGHTAGSSGSPFNETGGHAGTVYANGTENPPGNSPPGTANLDKAVSQYDIACFRGSPRPQLP
jgi:hypothetical protein